MHLSKSEAHGVRVPLPFPGMTFRAEGPTHCVMFSSLLGVLQSGTMPQTAFGFHCLLFGLFALSWAAPEAYGGSQARGRIGAVAPGLRQSHSNAGSEPHLRPTPQLTATPDR